MSDTLSSDILEQQFGPTKVEVLSQDGRRRVIGTRVAGSGQVLEISSVVFNPAGAAKFAATHQSVLNGTSMGKAFRADNIEFVRETRAVYKQALPANFERWFGGGQPATIVMVAILAGPDKTPYADILEIYSPQADWPQSGDPSGSLDEQQLAEINRLDKSLFGVLG